MKHLSALPEKAFEALVAPWLKTISKNESASILNLSQRNQLYRIHQLLENKELIKKYVGQKTPIQTEIINLMSLSIERPEELRQYLNKKCSRKVKHVFFILDADRLIEEKNELLGVLNALPYEKKNTSLLFFFSKNILLPRLVNKLTKYATVFQNTIIVPYYLKDDIAHYLDYEADLYHIKLPSRIKERILQQCGARMWLVKQAIRYYVSIGDEKKLFDHDDMRLRLKTIFNEFEEEEQELLKKIVNKSFIFTNEEKEIVNYFLKTRFLTVLGKKYKISIPLLERYIKNEVSSRFKFDVTQNNEVRINNVVIQGTFSRSQKRLLSFLINNPDRLISRDEVAGLLWSKSDNQYTDWALDMAINRIRHKLVMLGLNRGLITTMRGKGFIFSKNI